MRLTNIELKSIGTKKIRACGRQTVVGLGDSGDYGSGIKQNEVGLPARRYKTGGVAKLYTVPGHDNLLVLDLELEEKDGEA